MILLSEGARLGARGGLGLFVMALLASCGQDATREPSAADCVGEPLPLQNPRAFPLGETYYLPRLLAGEGCPQGAGWTVLAAPADSQNQVFATGAPEPRFTPEVPGVYTFYVPGVAMTPHALAVEDRAPADRFRNHYLTPLFGAARVGDEIWTANGPSYTVTRVVRDGEAWRAEAAIPVGSWPGAIAWRDPLPYALIAQRGSDTIGFLSRERGVLEDALWVGDEPSGIAITPDATRAFVSLATMREVAVVDLAAREVIARIPVGFDPRAVALSPGGDRLFVASYRSGNAIADVLGSYGPSDDQDVWIVDIGDIGDIGTLEIERVVTGVSADLRALAVSDDGAELFVAGTDGDPIPSQADPNALPFVHELNVVGADPGQSGFGEVVRSADLTRQPSSQGPVVNPSGVAATGDLVWVASESSDVVVALDRATLAEQFRVAVGPGARQIVAVDDRTVAVHCYQSLELWVISDAGGGQVEQVIALAQDPRPPEIALGERVFTRPGGRFATNHACTSCHVESQNDGMIWSFGPQIWHNVRPLQLLDATTPIEWGAYVSSTANFGYQGPGSIVGRPATPDEALGLQAFLGSLLGAPRATGHTRLDGSYSEAALRGKALFEGKATCFSCHTPPLYTSRELIPEGKSGEPADVPTLLGAYRHGVYFVAGQARSLPDALDVALDYVGVTLTADERVDLLAFLRELSVKSAAPLAIWPDIDSDEGVYPGVRPCVEFSEPVDASADIGDSGAATPEAVAARYVILEDADGARVDAQVSVSRETTGHRITLTPAAPLVAGAAYRFRVLPGLPFRSGGRWEGERSTAFTVAVPPVAAPAPVMTMLVTVMTPSGPADLPHLLEGISEGEDGHELVLVPLVFGTQQRQPLWARIDGDRFTMQPFALPVSPTGAVANAAEVVGTVTATDGQGGIARIDGTLRLGGPGIDVPGVPFAVVPAGPAGPPPGP